MGTKLTVVDALPGHDLVLTFQNEQPIPADDLGKLFRTLARDYRRLSGGRTLVVARIQTGSLAAHLRDAVSLIGPYVSDAVELAKGATAIAQFAKTLRDLIKKATTKKKSEAPTLPEAKPGTRSIEAICDVAAKSKSEVVIKHTTSGGDTLEVRLTPVEVVQIREATKKERAVLRLERRKELDALQSAHEPLRIADRLAAIYAHGVDGHGTDLQAVIEALASALRDAGFESILETIETDLASRGLHDLASLVRAEVHRSKGSEPPLSTS